jgi:hypothetical protein
MGMEISGTCWSWRSQKATRKIRRWASGCGQCQSSSFVAATWRQGLAALSHGGQIRSHADADAAGGGWGS